MVLLILQLPDICHFPSSGRSMQVADISGQSSSCSFSSTVLIMIDSLMKNMLFLTFFCKPIGERPACTLAVQNKGYHVLYSGWSACGTPQRKGTWFDYSVPSERKGVWERVAVFHYAGNIPQTETNQCPMILALENNDIGLIQDVELIKTAYQKDKLWPCVKKRSFVEWE